VFDCADGYIVIATGNDAQYRRLCGILGLAEMAEEPLFLTNADRINNRDEMTRRLTAETRGRTKADLLAACEAEGVPAGPINDLAEVFADPQVRHRALAIEAEGVPGVRSPFAFSGSELALGRASPRLDQHGEGLRRCWSAPE
jgi:crotonobetainyl-CoA:carnitine CoA-transferase CaiB-like acyl-CoA transferase